MNDRLAKQDGVLLDQKNQYEDRLKRAYEEKDGLITQCSQLQNEIKKLQEKLNSQAEQHQNALIQQNSLHEQSEIRWLKCIDQTKHEAKEMYKKSENTQIRYSEKINKLENELQNTRQELQEKYTQATVNLERNNQLKKEIKFLETEYIKARSTITKLEKQENISASAKNKSKKEKSLLTEAASE